jgi:hypothetical protein
VKNYWISSGKAAAAEQCVRDFEANQAAEAAIEAEKKRRKERRLAEEALRLKRDKRTRLNLVEKIAGFLSEANEQFRMEGRFLATARGRNIRACSK